MGSPALAKSVGTTAHHVERVYSIVEGVTTTPGAEEVSASWARSVRKYRIDPDEGRKPTVLSPGELRPLREPLEQLSRSAHDELDRLHRLVNKAGYVTLLCDGGGIAVDCRGRDADAEEFKYWGTWLGGVWSEETEGTNGIGTCIAEERPVTVHRSQHFRSRHIELSCSGAPIFGIDGKLMAVLDVSAIDPSLSEQAHALTGSLTMMSAAMIEERFFRECFRRDWIIALAALESESSAALLAVNKDQRIVGANRTARTTFSLDDLALREGIGVWSIFERDADLMRRRNGIEFQARLVIAPHGEAVAALVTPPGSSPAASRSLASLAVQARPRPALIAFADGPVPAPPAYGGLSRAALRRVREYIDAHLSERTQLVELAAVAGVSIHHFAREFKRSTGVTPHDYLTRKRVDRTREMLARTDWSLSEIAFAAGFSDQSHMTRHFRRLLGMTPGQFRWSQR